MSGALGDCLPVLSELNFGPHGIHFLFCPEAHVSFIGNVIFFRCELMMEHGNDCYIYLD